MGYAGKAACEAIKSAHKRHGIEFICQDDTLEIAMGENFYLDLCKEEPGVERAGNILCVPIYVDADMDGFVVRKRSAGR